MADKKIAVMQPYFFPYIGYFQLIHAVDQFVVFDDVNYINRGWINRNNLLINSDSALFTVPLMKASQNKKINEIHLVKEGKWRINLLKSIEANYKKAPCFYNVYPIIEGAINSSEDDIAAYNLNAIKIICTYLNIRTLLVASSSVYANEHLKGQDRIIDICKKENANSYINPIGGVELYDKNAFLNSGMNLFFIKSISSPYKQFNNSFVPGLSIIDVLFFNEKEAIIEMLKNFELI